MTDLTPDEVMVEMLKRTGRGYNIAVCHRVVSEPRYAVRGPSIDYQPRAVRSLRIMGKGMEITLVGETFRQIIEEYDMKKRYALADTPKKRVRAL